MGVFYSLLKDLYGDVLTENAKKHLTFAEIVVKYNIPIAKNNPNHDPTNGRFSSAGGTSTPSASSTSNQSPKPIKAIPKAVMDHIMQGEFDSTGIMNSGGHSQKAYALLKKNGLISDEKTLKNGVRVANVTNHQDASKRYHQGQTFFPEKWDEKTIRAALKNVHKQVAGNVTGTGWELFEATHNGVKIGLGYRDGDLKTGFPTKYQ